MSTRFLITAMAMLALAAACGNDSDDTSTGGDDASAEVSGAPRPPELDLATLQAQVPEGTYEAERVDAAHVGEVHPEMFIAVLPAPEPSDGAAPQVRAYLCDGDAVIQWFVGDLESDGSAELLPETLVAEDAPEMRIELTVDGDVSGVVSIGDDQQPVTLTEATAEAGLYTAEATFNGSEFVAGWIVLPDGRQVGGDCDRVCGRNPRTGEIICGPCRNLN
jgi:hypothetical protein